MLHQAVPIGATIVDSTHPISKYLIAHYHDVIYSNPVIVGNTSIDQKITDDLKEWVAQITDGHARLFFNDLYVSGVLAGHVNLTCAIRAADDIVHVMPNINVRNTQLELTINLRGGVKMEESIVHTKSMGAMGHLIAPNTNTPIKQIRNAFDGDDAHGAVCGLIQINRLANKFTRFMDKSVEFDVLSMDRFFNEWIARLPTPTVADIIGRKYFVVDEVNLADIKYHAPNQQLAGVLMSLVWSGTDYRILLTPHLNDVRLPYRSWFYMDLTPADTLNGVQLTKAKATKRWIVGWDELPQSIAFNPSTKSYYKYKQTHHEGIIPSESELVATIDVEVNPNASKAHRGWTLAELEAIVKHLKEQEK